jgi:homogentisate phytyltransferase/homogentisate geranylgeranyltransferase
MSQISDSKILRQYRSWFYALWKFSRPHTIIGTSLSVLGLYLVALDRLQDRFALDHWSFLVGTLIACLCGNVYIVGLNQLEDVAIDKINKPHLPLASGEFSQAEGIAIVTTTGCLALLLALIQGPFLLATVGLSLIIGTAYSWSPIRLKRFPLLASLCVFSVRGAIVNLGLFLHFNQVLDGPSSIPSQVWALTLFVLGFTFAIAIFKDIPDIEGDRQYNITTFTIQLGPQAVFNLARWVLTACYLGIGIGAFWLSPAQPWFMSLPHLLVLGLLWWRSLQVNLKSKREIANFYQFIWRLFFLEYLMFPIACLLG